MCEREEQIITKLKDVLPEMPDFEKGYILGVAESINRQRENDENKRKDDSVFRMLKGTSEWRTGMFETLSDKVFVTVERRDGKRLLCTARTRDGKWDKGRLIGEDEEIIAWFRSPELYKGIK